MSDEQEDAPVSDRVQAAIEQSVASAGGMVTGFAVTVEYIDDEGGRSWCIAGADNQSPSLTLGLLRFHQLEVERSTLAYLGDIDND